jgi:hypothetical protein
MPYLGDIPQAGGYQITISDSPGKIAITVFNIRRDRISEVENLVLTPNGQGVADTGPRTIGSNVGRIVFTVSLVTGTATMVINGNTVPVNTDATVTVDVI